MELTRRKPVDTAEAVAMTVFEFKRLAGSVVYGLKEIVTNFSSTAEQVSGPIAYHLSQWGGLRSRVG